MSTVRSLLLLSRNSFLGAAFSYVASTLLARYMGPSEFGLYSYILVLGNLASIFITFSTDATAAASFARCKNIESVLGAIYSFRLFVLLMLLFLLAAFGFENRNISIGVFIVSIASLNLSFLFELRSKNVQFSLLYMVERLCFACLILISIFMDSIDVTITVILTIVFLSSVGSLFAQIYINFGYFSSFKVRIDQIWSVFKENLFLVLVALSTFSYGGISRIILEPIIGQSQLGVYSAGWQFVLVVTIFSAQVSRVFRIKVANALINPSLKLVKKVLTEYLLFTTIPTAFLALGFYLFGGSLVLFLFGSEYAGIDSMIPWLSLYFVVINLDSLAIMLWTAKGKRVEYFVISSIWSISLLLTLAYSPDGAYLGRFMMLVVLCHAGSVLSLIARFYVIARRDLERESLGST